MRIALFQVAVLIGAAQGIQIRQVEDSPPDIAAETDIEACTQPDKLEEPRTQMSEELKKKVYEEDNPSCWPPPRYSQWALDILSADEENKKDKWQVKPAETLDLPNARLKTCCAH